MQFAVWEPTGALDPGPYLQWLDQHRDDLPPGARAFAAHPSHYDYGAYRVRDEPLPPGTPLCTRDLLLHDVQTTTDVPMRVELRLMFPGYELEHVGAYDLTLVYVGVTVFSIAIDPDPPMRAPIQLGGLMIDEVTASEDGAVHEMRFECGTVTVVCADLASAWR